MITLRELRQEARRRGVALGALEKDYILTLILHNLYAEKEWQDTLIFKGGTALHRFYLGRRLSLDLDFTASRPLLLSEIQQALEIPEIQTQIRDAREYHDALTIGRLAFVGPLGHPNSVKIDISFREKVQRAPHQLEMTTAFLPPFRVTCMALEEILAEKIRAALMRRTPRDYYDLWLLFQREDLDFDALPDLLRAKLDTVKRAYEPELLWQEPEVLRRLWVDDLRQLTRRVPAFDGMFCELRTLFEARMPAVLPDSG